MRPSITASTEYRSSIPTAVSGVVTSLRFTRIGRKPRSCKSCVNPSKTARNSGFEKLSATGSTSFVRQVVRLLASGLGLYPSVLAAAITLPRVIGETEAPSVKRRDPVERETPAFSATSAKVTRCLSRLFIDTPPRLSAKANALGRTRLQVDALRVRLVDLV